MKVKAFVFLFGIHLARSAVVPAIQSLYWRYLDYGPINALEQPSLSGTYGSLTDCGLVCTRSEHCSAFNYVYQSGDNAGVLCTMMSYGSAPVSFLEKEPATKYVHDIFAVPYVAMTINLTEYDCTCNVSSTYNSSTVCNNLWDDVTWTALGTEWVTKNEDAGGWVTLEWNEAVQVIGVEVWRRCWIAEQCSSLQIQLTPTYRITVTRGCYNGTNWLDCVDVQREIYGLAIPVFTNSVNITCLDDCQDAGSDDSWGLQEVKIWSVISN